MVTALIGIEAAVLMVNVANFCMKIPLFACMVNGVPENLIVDFSTLICSNPSQDLF